MTYEIYHRHEHLQHCFIYITSLFRCNFICTVSFHCLIVELFNRSRKFKVGNSFARVELSLLIRLWEFSRALHIAEGISRAWDKSSFGTRVKRRREGWRWNRRGQDLIEGRCVLSGRARFIRYFSRDLSIHSLILPPVARRRGTSTNLFLTDFEQFFPAPPFAPDGGFSRARLR